MIYSLITCVKYHGDAAFCNKKTRIQGLPRGFSGFYRCFFQNYHGACVVKGGEFVLKDLKSLTNQYVIDFINLKASLF